MLRTVSVVSVINYKGGVGGTTLAANIGAELAGRGRRVLLLVKRGDRVAARRYLAELGLTVAQLRLLAGELNISVPAWAKKDVFLDQLVQWTIGRRLDSEAITRPATAPAP